MRYFLLKSLVILFLSAGFFVSPLEAQYFGRNKVQYKNFTFHVKKTEHFDIYYHLEEKEAVEHAARMAERWYARLSQVLNHQLRGRQPLILYGSHPDFRQTNTTQGAPGEGTGGFTEAFKRRIVLPFAGPLAETDHVIGHELVHAFQFDLTGQGNPGLGFQAPAALRLPLWFIEGMAEYLAIGPNDANTAMWMREAARTRSLPQIKKLDDPRYFPYRYGHAFWAFVAGRWGDEVVGQILKAAAQSGNPQQAIKSVLGLSPDSLSQLWHRAIYATYEPVANLTQLPETYSRPLIAGKKGGNEINVAPVLSPDGSKIIFFSSRDLFSIELFVADANTGKILRRITKTAIDPHFESLEFISSSGAWEASGQRIVFAGVSKGQPVLSIYNMARDKIDKEISLPQLGLVLNPAWSPSGNEIAFSATINGLTDLFIYDLAADSLRRITNDAYADLQPAWSPDGHRLAFVTDRFSTNLSNLKIGYYQLAWLDVANGEIKSLPCFDDAKNINPQWSPDGGSLYFLSDRGGISNIYRLDLATASLHQVTNLFAGVSGITSLSPALSHAARAEHLVFNVYEGGQYSIYSTTSPQVLAGKPISAPPFEMNAAALPPLLRSDERLQTLLQNPLLGLPADSTFEVSKYHPRLSLDYVGQPYLVAGLDRFGAYVGGGVSFFWSDMLGDHNLAALLQVDGGFKDLAALVGYQNTKRRWNWGGVVQQIPYTTRYYGSGFATINNQVAYVEQIQTLRQINREIMGVVSYPFSQVQRVEFMAGFQNISFDEEIETRAISTVTGAVLIDEKTNLPTPKALNLGNFTAALVYDNSFFGATSPILGQRYRLELSPLAGSVQFMNALADYRHYFMPVRPFTLAARILHYGRYGKDAEDPRLSPLFLGYPGLVRGYEVDSFSPEECETGDCRVFNQLLGSKLLIANFELRFPLFRVLGIGQSFYGPLPIELGAFYDAGVAWQKNDKAWFLDGDRDPVSSFGGTLRFNLFGYAIAELNYVHPLDRPKKGWHWQFNFVPGF
ncbi:MAG: basic secretory protein-like protein [candidate division KSB1 bacterium]|nr:basic secretory protein-like protein [candidate division KSB1 bacterium]MDZ7304332.1 basic secretory protein-like protein [candidate division KSB1 bacterium]MDZ7313608.1 basic secretory protein-like protein [candidate division KSB1 bacterium]